MEFIGGIQGESLLIKSESPNDDTNIVEIKAADIQDEIKKEYEKDRNNILKKITENSKDEEEIKRASHEYNDTRETEKDKQGTDSTTTEIVQEKLILNYVNDDLHHQKKKRHRKRINNLGKLTRIELNEYSVVEDKKYCCNHCKVLTTSKRKVIKHIRQNHRDKAIFLNREKLLKTTTSRYIAWYEYTSEGDAGHRCCHCLELFEFNSQVESHIMEKHRTLSSLWKRCPHCSYQTLYDLTNHILYCHTDEKDIKYFRCAKCDFKAKRKDSLKRHIISLHIDDSEMPERILRCDHCPKVYYKRDSLKTHIKDVHRGKSVELKCFHCSYQCKTKESIKHHIATRHTNAEELSTLQCPQCSFQTKYMSRLHSHKSYAHTTTIQCHICSYQCRVKEVMKLHLIGHKENNDKDMKYRCDKCNYKTHRLYSFQIHKLKHLKPEEIHYFYCYHCKFKAKRKDNLKTHVLRHFKQNEVTFACYLCDFTTQRRSVLGKHLDDHSTAGNNMKELNDEDGLVPVVNKPSKNSRVDTKSKEEEVKGDEDTLACYLCDFTTIKQHLLVRHIDKHSKEANKVKKLKPEVRRSLPVDNTSKNEIVNMNFEGDARQDGKDALVCNLCDFTTLKQHLLIRHMGKHKKEANKKEFKPVVSRYQLRRLNKGEK